MANITEQLTLVPVSGALPLTIDRSLFWKRVVLGAIVVVSISMNFFQLGQNGFGNLYYASGIRSMADSWHNFFFVSFDPGGFVTIDKPPVGFWLQTLSVKLFGFTPFSIFLPQALCGVFAVVLLYYLVRRHFGITAGLIAALALAVSPISVATDRNNTIDGTLALILLLSVWAVMRACETRKLRWLLLGGVLVGLGFNTKMSEAYLIIPALVTAYLLCGPRKIWKCIWHLAVFLVVMLAISLSWAAAVDMTPAAQRPYVGSTKDNSEISLAVGYNGLNRLHINLGGNTKTRATTNTTTRATLSTTTDAAIDALQSVAAQIAAPDSLPPTSTGGPPKNSTLAVNSSSSFRLFDVQYGSQIGWLLPFALLAILALVWRRRTYEGRAQQSLGLVIWGLWLLTMTVFFSLDNSFHQYYLTVMAPGLCALVGIGLVVMWQQYRAPGWRGWLLPIALGITAAVQLSILAYYPQFAQNLRLFILIPSVVVVLFLLLFRLLRRRSSLEDRDRNPEYQSGRAKVFPLASIAVTLGMLALLVAPAAWSLYTVVHNPESAAPVAGPSTQNKFNGFLTIDNKNASTAPSKADSALISYLEAQQGNTKFLVAVPMSANADALILAANRPVMAMGGFNGNDPILTPSSLQASIKNATVRFFEITPANKRNTMSRWISEHCKTVPAKDWQPVKGAHTKVSSNQLYDCSSAGA